MPPEKEITQQVVDLGDRMMWSVVGLFVLGTLARKLVSAEPFDARRFAGEVILSFLAALVLYFGGLLQGLGAWELIVMGALGGLGGVRSIEWTLKIARYLSTRVK